MTHGNLWRTFVRVAGSHPDREAYVGPEGALDYRQLAVAAAMLADRLCMRKVGAGDLVTVEMPVGSGFVVGVLAAVAVGATYLPIDVSGPARRREQILEDARPSVVLQADDDDLRAALRLSETSAAPGSPDPGRHDPATDDDDPAYVIYTSGSTGRPKGVVVPARGVHNLLAAFQSRAPLSPGARHSWWTSPGFDVSVYEMWSALLNGGTVVPVPDAHRRDIDATLDYLAEHHIDSAYLPPQFLPSLRDRVVSGGPAPRLRRLLTGVEPIPIGLLVDLQSCMPDVVVVNGYGPTETTVCATLYTVPERCTEPQRRTPIGSVIEGNRGFVLDDRLAPVGPGQPGELCVAGRGLALGYLHDPSRTAERFVAAADGDGLMYRTGDLVVADVEGELTFLGRIDDQLKIDGVRIEPAETEVALRRLDEISDVAVLARPTSPGGPLVLTAFVVLSDAVGEATGDLWTVIRARLAEELPAQAVPRRFFALERIPMTSDGKLDRAALPQPNDAPARPARNEHERTVEDACRALLPHTPPSALDLGFAEIGGDSLQAARLSIALRSATGRAVTAAHVLEAETLADLAAKVSAMPVDDASDDENAGQSEAPLTPGQAGMWAAELISAAPGSFHESVALELTGPVDPDRTARELTAVLNRHVVFRGCIDEGGALFVTDGEPVSVAVRSVAPGESLEHGWQQLLAELQRPAFDVTKGPLVRAAVLAAPDTVRVLLVWHHLVIDAWSARVVLEELTAALSGHAPSRSEEHGHADYAHRQRSYLDSTEGKLAVCAAADRIRAWLPPLGEGESGPVQSSCSVTELAVGPRVWSKVRDCARRNGTTVFAVTLAATLEPVCQLAETGGRFALTVADRNEPADAAAAGYFLTTVPFGLPPGDGRVTPGPNDALRRAREVIAEAREMSRVPFPALMAELGLRETRSVAPLVIAWDRDPATALSVPGCTVRSLSVSPLGVRWPWTVLFTDRADLGMSGRIEFPPWVPGDRVARFGAELESMLDEFASLA
ncbi:amino acid adenylation domain-containing protein [Streptomyces sp. RB6PN25]|uniref:Amino acid adenylation domain-containing protein n=1 Tax=Streptomyces humicola TaxID=2953240 RepID=A0ABT1PTU3_9ACTN|nr:amino acid adenylation domain-containing protein [Streptomyces humicola]MCQ4081089.1 amino acid adenylation domain-containing protein [Streptomyces humicola]